MKAKLIRKLYTLLFVLGGALAGLAWYYLVGLTTLFFRKRVMWIPQSMPTWAIVALGVTIGAFTVLRNLPWWPFTILAP